MIYVEKKHQDNQIVKILNIISINSLYFEPTILMEVTCQPTHKFYIKLFFLQKTEKVSYLKTIVQNYLNISGGVINNHNSHLYRVNGVENHMHILTSLHPSVALADLIKDIKVSSSLMIKKEKLFPDFKGWQIGYGAFTYSIDAKERLIKYIMRQKEHHKKVTFVDEYKMLLKEFDIEFDEKYLF